MTTLVKPAVFGTKNAVFIALSIVIVASAALLPDIPGLSYEGKITLAILAAGIVLWITESLPLPATALLVLVSMPILGVCSFEAAFSNSVSGTIFFLLGPFAFTVALDATTIPTRIAGVVLKWSGTNTKKMLLGFMTAVAALSMVMSDVAACGVFISVGKRLLELNKAEKGVSHFGKALMIGIPWASYAGGCAVMTGNGCNVLAVDLFAKMFGIRVTFVDWMILGVPIAIALLVVAWLVLTRMFKPEAISEQAIFATLEDARNLDKLAGPEKATLCIIVLAIVGWILSSWIPAVNTALVAILALVALSIPGCCVLDFKTLIARMNWGVILMIMCVLSVSHFIVETGAGEWIVNAIIGALPEQAKAPLVVLAVASTIGCLVHNVVPVGPAVAGILAFPFGVLAEQFGISVSAMVMVVAWQASISYMLPLDCVPILTYSCGYYKMGDMVRVGWIPSIVLVVLTVTVLPALCSLLGLP